MFDLADLRYDQQLFEKALEIHRRALLISDQNRVMKKCPLVANGNSEFEEHFCIHTRYSRAIEYYKRTLEYELAQSDLNNPYPVDLFAKRLAFITLSSEKCNHH
jgi:hypothetical protein